MGWPAAAPAGTEACEIGLGPPPNLEQLSLGTPQRSAAHSGGAAGARPSPSPVCRPRRGEIVDCGCWALDCAAPSADQLSTPEINGAHLRCLWVRAAAVLSPLRREQLQGRIG